MRKTLMILMCLLLSYMVQAQDEYTKAIPQLLQQLKKARADTGSVSLLLKIAHFYVFKPGEQVKDLDSAVLMARQAEALSGRLHYPRGTGLSYLVISQAWREKGDTARGRPFADMSIVTLSRYGSKLEQGNAWKERSMYPGHVVIDERSQKIYYEEKAVQLYKESGDSLTYAKELVFLSEITDSGEDLEMALEALRIFRNIGYKDLQGVLYLIGSQYSVRNNPIEAIRYCEMAVAVAEERDSTMQLCTVYNRMGLAYYEIGEREKAKEFFLKALGVAERHRDMDAIWTLVPNVTSEITDKNERVQYLTTMLKKFPLPADDFETRVRMNSIYVHTYTELGRTTLAKFYLNESLSIIDNLRLTSWYRMPFYRSAIVYYMHMHEYDAAAKLLKLYEEQVYRRARTDLLAENHLTWSGIDSARGDFAAAFAHYKAYKTLEDSITLATKTREFARVQVEFETIRKAKDLKLRERDITLLHQQAQLQKEELKRVTIVRNMIIVGAVLLLLLLILGYNRYRLKQHTNRELQSKQHQINRQNISLKKLIREKDWLVKEIHHRVKNNLQIVVSLLNTQAAHMEEGSALAAIRDSRLRMQAIALLHQKLYQVENAGLIDVSCYINELVGNLRLGCDCVDDIRFHVEIAPVLLDVSQATPVGLLLNEAITNAIKYAFQGRGKGNISVLFKQLPERMYLLSVADDGVGLPADFKTQRKRGTFGMSLIDTLTQQLDGTLELVNNAGLTLNITFREQWEEHSVLYNEDEDLVPGEYV
ncbi:histidine kinase dimerization/phosphoacceptor domain -containing protein [Chitinophaga pinensis]|nr:histidine kinase dimerization/phosphoacceptor domain -containing protein [Chitinophaga pinensis]